MIFALQLCVTLPTFHPLFVSSRLFLFVSSLPFQESRSSSTYTSIFTQGKGYYIAETIRRWQYGVFFLKLKAPKDYRQPSSNQYLNQRYLI